MGSGSLDAMGNSHGEVMGTDPESYDIGRTANDSSPDVYVYLPLSLNE